MGGESEKRGAKGRVGTEEQREEVFTYRYLKAKERSDSPGFPSLSGKDLKAPVPATPPFAWGERR